MKLKIMLLSVFLLFSKSTFAESIENERLALKKLNIEIGAAEDRGDRQWLANILAPELSFRRANGLVIGKDKFLKDVQSRSASKTEIENVTFYGKDRAIVTCIVTLNIDGKNAAFHNVRLFIKDKETWKLLGWANEPLTAIQ